ncbi:MAG TPA: transposase [Sideroxyarcus sp.]|nr:transposase [Sideroxyarcus sp.]
MHCSLQEIFDQHFESYAQGHALHPRERHAAWCIRYCHRAEMGSHVLVCPEGHHSQVQYHACRHRSCPRCAVQARQQWLATQLPRLLPCPHFHVIFTLPHELIAMWLFNRAWFNTLLFDSARESLLQLCTDPRHLGATPGLLMALHTWGRTLSRHPHVHCLVSAGGLDAQQQWRASRHGFLVPVLALQRLFRGKLLSQLQQALHAQQLQLPPSHDAAHWQRVLNAQWHSHWNVQISEPYEHGRGVALYLARYVKGGPLGPRQSFELEGSTVRLPYVDHRDGQHKVLALHVHEFISRVLCHAPPRGQHTVRQAGLYATARHEQHARCRALLASPAPPLPSVPLACHDLRALTPAPTCPTCRLPLLRQVVAPVKHHRGEVSIPRLPPTSRLCPTLRSNGRPQAPPVAAA